MKIRIKDNSLRYRVTLRELGALQAEGKIERHMRVPGPAGAFCYALVLDSRAPESSVCVEDRGIRLILAKKDFETLCRLDEEGVYLRREWQDESGEAHRFIAFVEKDRPGSACEKAEEWIYDESPGRRPETQPIPAEGD